jgi:hypothetical protein
MKHNFEKSKSNKPKLTWEEEQNLKKPKSNKPKRLPSRGSIWSKNDV